MSATKSQPPLFHVGDWVKFDYGPKKNFGKIVEDRGLLGIAGRRLYRVLVPVSDVGEALDDPPTEQIPKLLDAQASAFEIPENGSMPCRRRFASHTRFGTCDRARLIPGGRRQERMIF